MYMANIGRYAISGIFLPPLAESVQGIDPIGTLEGVPKNGPEFFLEGLYPLERGDTPLLRGYVYGK